MTLSAEQYRSIVNSLKERSTAKSTQSDKRRAPRLTNRMHVFALMDSETRPVQTHVRDISSRGICILRKQPMKTGQQFVVQLPRIGEPTVPILCTVVHCRPAPGDQYSIGAEFTCVLAASQASAAPADELERIRRSVLS